MLQRNLVSFLITQNICSKYFAEHFVVKVKQDIPEHKTGTYFMWFLFMVSR